MQLGRETLSFWVKAFSGDTAKRLENFGFIQFRPGGNVLLLNLLDFKDIFSTLWFKLDANIFSMISLVHY